MKILGIETSCDDIGISIYDYKKGIIFNNTYNQKIHKKFGGTVPNIASNYHLNKIDNLINLSFIKSKIKKNNIDGIACTSGPGLFGSLLIGTCFGKSLSYSLKIPFYEINHLEGHLFSPLIEFDIKNIKFPFIGLIISGGNTQLIKVNKIGDYIIIGKTLDDSIGETIDKVANLLNLNYPGGPEIYKISKDGINNIYKFPRPMINSNTLDFSFSGLKTYIKYFIKNIKKPIKYQTKANIALELQNCIIDVLIKKSILSLNKFNINTLLVSGGVSSNILLRKRFNEYLNNKNINIMFPKLEFCTDNGAMIAYICVLNILYNKNFIKKRNNLEILINSKWSIDKDIF